jgi:two-component system KDP operon response regulator KdpE
MKVLLVGDDPYMMKDVSSSLRSGWPDAVFTSAAMGSKGIDLVEAETPDLVMADFCLPDMRCVDLVARIRQFSHVPLIVLDGEATPMDRAELLEAGADRCFVKPYWPAEIQARVKALVRRTGRDSFKPSPVPFAGGNREPVFLIDHCLCPAALPA